MSLKVVPLDSSNERQHRTVIATATNELVKVRPPHDLTEAERAAGIGNIDGRYPPCDVRRYFAKVDGVTNDRDALHNAMQAAVNGGGAVLIPPGTLLVGSSVAIPGSIMLCGSGKSRTIIKRGFSGDLFTAFASSSSIHDLTIDGEQGTYGAGTGVFVEADSFGQFMSNVAVIDFSEACLEFEADGGSQFSAVGCTFYTTGTLNSVAAVKVTGTDTDAVPRKFAATESNGCTLFDFGNCDDFFVWGGYTNGLIFGTSAAQVCITGLRCGSAGTYDIKGGNHHIVGNPFAIAVTISAVDCIFEGNSVPDWDITDNGTGNAIEQRARSYTPTWTQTSGTQPALGNGTIVGRYSRHGSRVDVLITLTMGSTTTFGNAATAYRFSLPRVTENSGITQYGLGYITDSSTGVTTTNKVVVGPNEAGCKLSVMTSGADVRDGAPIAWATGDKIEIRLSYLCS